MPTILLYFFIALVVVGGVILCVPADNSAPEEPYSPRDILMQVKP
jgi:hypothetical protein